MALKRDYYDGEEGSSEEMVNKKLITDRMPRVSVIVALYNAESYIVECLESLLVQTYKGEIEISVHDDSSIDKSISVLEGWIENHDELLQKSNIKFLVSKGERNQGAGAARNAAIRQSTGHVIIIQDADDIALPHRVELQVNALLAEEEKLRYRSGEGKPLVLVGSRFRRLPEDATHHYTQWANHLTQERLHSERFRECTLIHPTWCYRRSTYDTGGGYPSDLAEDLSLFLNLGKLGVRLVKVEEELVVYRHVGDSLVSKTPRKHLLHIRVRAFQDQVLTHWCNRGGGYTDFVVWNSGRDGRDFVNALEPEFRNRIRCFLDVDDKKIGKPYHNGRVPGFKSIDVVHWRDAPEGLPIVLCVSMGRTAGAFEANVCELAQSRNLKETVDYWHFI